MTGAEYLLCWAAQSGMQKEQAAAALINGTFHCKCMAGCIWLNQEGLVNTGD